MERNPKNVAGHLMDASDILCGYYRDSQVRERILEFLGGDRIENLSSRFITADDINEARRLPRPVEDLVPCMDQGMEICRSLWDRDFLVAHLDIEYVNFDFPGEAYLHPKRIFDLQDPVVHLTKKLLRDYGIEPLHILSGRGHHFVWQIRQDSTAFKTLIDLGHGPPSSQLVNSHSHTFNGEPVPARLTEAFAGLGLVMEFLAHLIKEQAAPLCAIPVELTAVEVGPGECGREMISIDISEYGDPLSTRATRVPFSAYLKPWQQQDLIGRDLVQSLSPIFFIPLHDMDIEQGIRVMRDVNMTRELAGNVSTKIPEHSRGMAKLISKYMNSSLQLFHDWFYSHRHHQPEDWPNTYDQTPLDPLPACARVVLAYPNDLLLRPGGMRLITRVMLALGWHPRHIAGLIRSKFERDFGWGDQWQGYDPSMRADFYTRIFAGLFAVGRDDLVDLNCQSSKEENTCTVAECPGNLEWFRQSALARRRYYHLAHRPFNALFLTKEHL
jgi:hypothetical protein